MKKSLLVIVLTSFLLFSCGGNNNSNTNTNTPDKNIDVAENNGKRTFLGFVATWCPHCQDEMPVYDEFYKEYADRVNMQIVVVDGKKFPGNYSIPQDLSKPITYEQATKEKCDYIPSYVIYDENKNIIDKQCGAKLTKELLIEKLIPKETISSNQENMANTYQTQNFTDGDIGVIMTTTNGKMEIKLFPEEAPKTVLNFLGLAKKGYYDGIVFHRVIKDFMIQGGDPTATGMGGESIYGKEFEDEFHVNLKNIRGSLSMANAGPNTNGSQFFINQKDNNFLDNKHSVFGQVITGLDNVDKIASVKTDANDKPEKEVKIIKMEIVQFKSGSLQPYEISLEEKLKELEDKKQAKLEADKNRVVGVGDEIAVHYIGKTASDKKEFDNSYSRNIPLEFTVGTGMMIPGFDKGVLGMKIGEKKTLNIKAADGYGEYDPTNIQEVQKSELKDFEDAGYKIEVGTKLPTMYGEFTIKEVKGENVKIDLNHFLSGKDLIFDVEMVEFKN